MSETNDAIATWSGFNYQGKTTILCVLMEINELLKNNVYINDYSVELEKFEDFVIYENCSPKSLYQVKATLSRKTASGYKTAIDKLKSHRTELKNNSAKCILICPINIRKWDSGCGVDLLLYNDNVISLNNIIVNIKEEIQKFFCLKEIRINDEENVYLNICNFLDTNVSRIHLDGRNSNYKISFGEFADCMINYNENYNEQILAKRKEEIYNHITNNIENSLSEYCINYCNKEAGFSYDQCDNDCGAKQHFEDVINIDILTYCQITNPDIINIEQDHLSYVELMPRRYYTKNIYDIFKKSNLQDIKKDKNLSYIKDTIFHSKKRRIIPTFLDFDSERVVEISLDQINKNDDIKPYIEGNILVASAQGLNTTITKSKITFMNDEGYEDTQNKTTNFKFDTMIIDKGIYFNKLEGN